MGPSTAGVGPVTAVPEHAAGRTHASTATGTSVPILTPSALTTPATVPGPVGARRVEPRHRENPPQPALRRLSTTVFPRQPEPPAEPRLDFPGRTPRPTARSTSSHRGPGWTPRKNTSPNCQKRPQSPGVKAGFPRKTHRPSSQPHPSRHWLRAHRQRGARDHHCPGETRVSTRHPSSLWQCSPSNRRSGPHQLFGNGSRSIGQLMHRGPPRPDPNSEPGMVSTSTPAASRRRLVSTLRL